MTLTQDLKRVASYVIAVLAFLMIIAPRVYADAGIAINPSYGAPLSQATVSGQGFCASCGSISILMNGSPISQATADAKGTFSTTFTVPGSSRPGPNSITASQMANGSTLSAETDFEVVINPNQNGGAQQTTPPANQTNLPGQAEQVSKNGKSVSKSNSSLFILLITLLAIYLVGLLLWRLKKQNSKPAPKKKR